MGVFIAAYRSDCSECDEPLEEGQLGHMSYDGPAHVRCPEARPEPEREPCPRCYLVHGIAQEECD